MVRSECRSSAPATVRYCSWSRFFVTRTVVVSSRRGWRRGPKAKGISPLTKLALPRGKTDWARLRALSDEDRLAGALADPDAQPLTDELLARARRANDVNAIRAGLGMTQARFSECHGVPLSTRRNWAPRCARPRPAHRHRRRTLSRGVRMRATPITAGRHAA
jgi:DNA-binding transcriptional regulator YiaG